MHYLLILLTFLSPTLLPAQDHHDRLATLDVQHYRFALELSDENDVIDGQATIRLRFHRPVHSFALDLVSPSGEKGMTASAVRWNGQAAEFKHQGEQLTIQLPRAVMPGESYTLEVDYRGIPADGLIISTNDHGERTFFGDNWPNRAHHWLPTADHPSDKATVEFIVTAPVHYQVIANGIQVEESNLPDGRKLTHWRADEPLPTKVMVIGAAAFAVQQAGEVAGVPVTSWVFPQVRKEGFYDYAQAVPVLDWFVTHIGPYPYRKLANVQSKTRYGGMENAGNIFYYEGSVTGERKVEALIAHEIAHQWFGNSASEANWHHVWLSEGFATYLTNLYLEHRYGSERLREQLAEQRREVIDFAEKKLAPIIDTTVTNYNALLNANSYEKGGWVLHLLRRRIGDEAFWEGLRTYYRRYQYANALTEDFRRVMEEVSGQDLKDFFQQWLYQPGFPDLDIRWKYDRKGKTAEVEVRQRQQAPFTFPLTVQLRAGDGKVVATETFDILKKEATFRIPLDGRPAELVVDPEVDLLFKAEVKN